MTEDTVPLAKMIIALLAFLGFCQVFGWLVELAAFVYRAARTHFAGGCTCSQTANGFAACPRPTDPESCGIDAKESHSKVVSEQPK